MNNKRLTILLTCFAGTKGASAARKSLASGLTSQGDTLLQTSVLQVKANHRASIHDPQRVLRGTLTSALTWGAFGLVAGTNRVESALIWGFLGAICGGLYAYTTEHLLTKDELGRLGQRLPAPSSALLTYARTDNAKRLLGACAQAKPSTASAVEIGADLEAHVYAGSAMPLELPHGSGRGPTQTNQISLLAMILVRYPDPKTARRVAATAANRPTAATTAPQIELVVETAPDGRRRVSDPAQGVGTMARSDVISWGGFGLVCGAIVGLVGGGGILGFLEDGVVTGIGWGVFGLAAGALYGLWAGRSISARRLRGIGDILPNGSSAILAWADGPVGQETASVLDGPGAERLVLCFNPVQEGAVLEVL